MYFTLVRAKRSWEVEVQRVHAVELGYPAMTAWTPSGQPRSLTTSHGGFMPVLVTKCHPIAMLLGNAARMYSLGCH